MFDSNANNVYGGFMYNPQNGQMQTKQGSTLTQEEYNRLVKQDNPFSLALTETELLRGICNHRKPDGSGDTLVQDTDGTVRCEVCGHRFMPVDSNMTPESVQEAVALTTDILQTIKLLYVDMPVPAQREFFQIIPLLEKVPQLFDLAVRNFNKHENYNAWGYRGQNMGTMNLFNMLSGALNSGAPMYGYGYNNGMPNMAGQPVGSVPPMSNGFGYPNGMPQQQMMGGMPNMGYNPQTQGFQYNPQGGMTQQPGQQVPYQMPQQPPVQPGTTAPADTKASTDGQTVNAQSTFKA